MRRPKCPSMRRSDGRQQPLASCCVEPPLRRGLSCESGAAATFLALADVLGRPVLAVVGFAFVLFPFAAREAWLWRGAGRQWLLMTGGLIGFIALGFLAQQLLG